MSTYFADLCKHTETASGLLFQLITGSRWFALFRDVSRPVRGLPSRHTEAAWGEPLKA